MVQIRKASIQDLDKVMDCRIEMLKAVNSMPEGASFDKTFVDDTKDYFSRPCQTTVLAMEEEQVIGCATICYIHLMPTFDHPTGKRAHLMNVYTKESYRRQGIARRMLELLIGEAREKGVTEISLDTTREGRSFYESCGFQASEEGMVLNWKE